MASVEYESNADRVAARINATSYTGLVKAAEFVLGVSNSRVPLDTSMLQQSGAVSGDPAQCEAIISYDTPYAVAQHEELTWRHAPGQEAKYLENAANESTGEVLQIVATEHRRANRG